MMGIALQNDESYRQDKPQKNMSERMYDSMKALYNARDMTLTFDELKSRDAIDGLVELEQIGFVDRTICKIERIAGREYQRVRSYGLTNKGREFFTEFETFGHKYGMRDLKDIVDDFKLSLEYDRIQHSALDPKILGLRQKLKDIEKSRRHDQKND